MHQSLILELCHLLLADTTIQLTHIRYYTKHEQEYFILFNPFKPKIYRLQLLSIVTELTSLYQDWQMQTISELTTANVVSKRKLKALVKSNKYDIPVNIFKI